MIFSMPDFGLAELVFKNSTIRNYDFVYDETNDCYFLQETADYTVKVENLFGDSIREFIKLLSICLSNSIAVFLNRVNALLYSQLSMFFGLCCSRPTYIFSTISGANSTRTLSL